MMHVLLNKYVNSKDIFVYGFADQFFYEYSKQSQARPHNPFYSLIN